MTVAVKKVIRLVRIKEKDNNEIKYSDYDILQALNEAIAYTSMHLSTMNSDFLEKALVLDEKDINRQIIEENAHSTEQKELISFRNTGVDLPDDYLSLMGVIRLGDDYKLKCTEAGRDMMPDQYYLLGNKLFAGTKVVRLLYRASINLVTNSEENINLPEFFLYGLAKMTSMILNNNAGTDVMREAMDAVIDSLIPHRRYSNLRTKMPFKV